MKKIRLFHITSASTVDSILKEGIKPSKTQCKLPLNQVQPPERNKAVFAYDETTLRRIAKYGRPDDKIIEFEADAEQTFIGELRAECSPKYKETVKRLSEHLEAPWKTQYVEPEIFIPKEVSPEMIVKVHERRNFV